MLHYIQNKSIKILMILYATLLLGAFGYLFYTSKKGLSLDTNAPLENPKENDELYKDLEDLFI